MSDREEEAAATARVRAACAEVGLSIVGITQALALPDHELYLAWLAAGYAGELAYLHRDAADRADVRNLLPQARSVLTVALSYHFPFDEEVKPGHGKIARYARGTDYHLVLKARLQDLVSRLASGFSDPLLARVCVDTAPLLERSLAAQSGLGFVGKNTLLISPGIGSYTVLGEVLLSVPLSPAAPQSPRCGECRLCLDACPTEALRAPFQLDARRCISYLTIENSGEVPVALRKQVGDWIFGCDICQSVCPYNARAPLGDAELAPKAKLCSPLLSQLLSTGAAQYRQLVKRTALRRINRNSLLRNVAVALGNVGTPADLPVIAAALLRESSLVRIHLSWAAAEIALRHPDTRALVVDMLQTARSVESDAEVAVALDADIKRLPAQAPSPARPDQPLSSPCSR